MTPSMTNDVTSLFTSPSDPNFVIYFVFVFFFSARHATSVFSGTAGKPSGVWMSRPDFRTQIFLFSLATAAKQFEFQSTGGVAERGY